MGEGYAPTTYTLRVALFDGPLSTDEMGERFALTTCFWTENTHAPITTYYGQIPPIMFVCTASRRINITSLRLLSTLSHCSASMPPKRKINAKHDDANTVSDNESVSQSQPQAKRAKRTAPTSDDVKAPNGQPTNKVLPVNIAFAPRAPGTLRFVTWNVCGLAAAQRKVSFRLNTIDCA